MFPNGKLNVSKIKRKDEKETKQKKKDGLRDHRRTEVFELV
jgi:hypothetical protein